MVRAILAAWLLAAASGPAHAAISPAGYWFTEDHGGVVQIRACGDVLCGVIVGLKVWPANGRLLDVRGQPQCQLTLLAGLRRADDDRWHGTVTNPEDGRTYSAEVWVGEDGVLRLHGYIGLPILGSTQHWPRYDGPKLRPDCHFP